MVLDVDHLQCPLHIKHTLNAESDQQFAVGCQKSGRQTDWKVNGTELQYSSLGLMSAERSGSPQTHTCRSGPAASIPPHLRSSA